MGIVTAVRRRRLAPLTVILVPNRVDHRTLEGQQLERELQSFDEIAGPAIGSRSVFVRAFAKGQSVADMVPKSNSDGRSGPCVMLPCVNWPRLFSLVHRLVTDSQI